mmetsp:Transcript_777/g.2249  ORF Transcript_777/g.2249 Transcript_777/m.2249 type:complete len:275 (+) Transcript_777:229-1053(+)
MDNHKGVPAEVLLLLLRLGDEREIHAPLEGVDAARVAAGLSHRGRHQHREARVRDEVVEHVARREAPNDVVVHRRDRLHEFVRGANKHLRRVRPDLRRHKSGRAAKRRRRRGHRDNNLEGLIRRREGEGTEAVDVVDVRHRHDVGHLGRKVAGKGEALVSGEAALPGLDVRLGGCLRGAAGDGDGLEGAEVAGAVELEARGVGDGAGEGALGVAGAAGARHEGGAADPGGGLEDGRAGGAGVLAARAGGLGGGEGKDGEEGEEGLHVGCEVWGR